jgi:hypothetical protein
MMKNNCQDIKTDELDRVEEQLNKLKVNRARQAHRVPTNID